MTVFLDWRFLNETKISKKPKRFYRFLLSPDGSYGEGGCANRLSFVWGHSRRRMSFCVQIIDLFQNSYFGRHVRQNSH